MEYGGRGVGRCGSVRGGIKRYNKILSLLYFDGCLLNERAQLVGGRWLRAMVRWVGARECVELLLKWQLFGLDNFPNYYFYNF